MITSVAKALWVPFEPFGSLHILNSEQETFLPRPDSFDVEEDESNVNAVEDVTIE